MLGVELAKVVIANLRPWFLEINLSGRKILSRRSDFMKLTSISVELSETMLATTIMKSKMFQGMRM
jgi:hypothetical protein